ncbi:hypothetical protein ABEB36_013527 [Hypothenemus hampei]|uniref:Uncharacterized protein n=1 Tax=Hypothenemus hampei TaxID=57062 RepID=A0ABD1E4U9_HYPHA
MNGYKKTLCMIAEVTSSKLKTNFKWFRCRAFEFEDIIDIGSHRIPRVQKVKFDEMPHLNIDIKKESVRRFENFGFKMSNKLANHISVITDD